MALDRNKTEYKNRAVRLYSYIEKALCIDDTITRDFRLTAASPTPWWIADLPNDADSLFVRDLESNKQPAPEAGTEDGWLVVQKKGIKSNPPIPELLKEWLPEITPLQEPKPLPSIERKIRFNHDPKRASDYKEFCRDFKEGKTVPDSLKGWVVLTPGKLPESIEERYESDHFKDHPELALLLNGYIEQEWKAWAQEVIKVYQANLLYDQLYALRLLLKNEGDNFELLWGQGLLAWQAPVGTVYAPLFLTPISLDFDPVRRIIRVIADPMSRSFVEIASLYEMDNPAELDLVTWADRVNSDPFDFWHFESLRTQAQWLANSLSKDSEDCFSEVLSSAPEPTDKPCIWNAPVIFARKRSNDLWSKYAGLIRKDIEQSDTDPTPFISDLVGAYDNPAKTEKASVAVSEESSTSLSLSDAELHFPLPWNDEQKRIAERLEGHYGVVVKGPPGTGKSHTIANLISRFLAQGKTVLVTSQTSKALAVLRDKLPASIRSLAVSQLNQTAGRDEVLQQSISEISSNLGERQTRYSEQKAEALRRELATLREEKAKTANQIRQFVLTDSTVTLDLEGETVKPLQAAEFISKCQEDDTCSWFVDDVPVDAALTFSADDLQEAFELLTELAPDERELQDSILPDITALPNEDMVKATFSSLKELEAKSSIAKSTLGGVDLTPQAVIDLLNEAEKARTSLKSMSEPFQKEVFAKAAVSKAQRSKWLKALEKMEDRVETLSSHGNDLLGHKVVGTSTSTIVEQLSAIEQLQKQANGAQRISKLSKLILPAQCKKLLTAFRVDGQEPDSTQLLGLLKLHVEQEQAHDEIATLLSQAFEFSTMPSLNGELRDVVALEVLLGQLRSPIHYHDDYRALKKLCDDVPKFNEFELTDSKCLDRIIEALQSKVALDELQQIRELLGGWEGMLTMPKSNGHPVFKALKTAIEELNSTAWSSQLVELRSLAAKQVKASRLNELRIAITIHAHRTFAELVHLANTNVPYKAPGNLAKVWRCARLTAWLNSIHDHADIDELQNQHERLSRREMQLNAELITVLAWQRQIDKVTKPQRDALMAWSHEMKKFGKGTGKYALTHLRAAQGALQDAKDAVPVWIMPLHRVAQMFSEPQAGMFDIVIVDEASQCDLRGLTIGYLGKQLLVVGDPEQISPEGVFMNQERIFELITRYLYDIPYKESFSITSSLFDLAKIRLSNIIQLNEHFRCVPDIIAFSNHYIYEGKLRPLRYPNPQGLLAPALVPVYVESGYQNLNNKVNEPEAKALIDKLVELLNDPKYDKRPDGQFTTFGIISLLAEDQAKYIEKLIRDLVAKGELSEKVVEERRIECGDAYKFQGDERDIMLLSMVRALDPNKLTDTVAPMTDERAKRRFNVAASRAREQMFLFHSLPLSALGNPNDWRYKLLNWFYDPKSEEIKAGREALKKEFDSGRASQFSFDVGNLILDRGYQVIPEYPVIGYRIDLVVQGSSARLAVECDGDQYHTLENWEEDQVRERQLRRGGWEFWRVSGSAFYRHRDRALDSLWTRLSQLGIKPLLEDTLEDTP
ncbi:AAA family ATPase [bacterium]|nr:AAA family ATPase [bacterium]